MCQKIGITGGSGSGKGYICAILTEMGFPCIDTDRVVHNLYSQNTECQNELRSEFGDGIFENGVLVRARLARIVFSDPKKLAALNLIVHKYVIMECDRICNVLFSQGNTAVFIDAPQLYEAGMDKHLDAVIAVLAPRDIRISRILMRDCITESQANSRLDNQHTDDFFMKNADYVIQNANLSDDELKLQLKEIITKLGL